MLFTLLLSVWFALAGDVVPWQDQGMLKAAGCTDVIGWGSYAPIVLTPTGIRVYVNTNCGKTAGTWFLRSGTWAGVGKTQTMLRPGQVFDQTGHPYIRTSAVGGAPGAYYALLGIGDGYPSVYRPALATSPDGLVWTYRGKILVDGTAPEIDTNSNAIIVQLDKPAVLDLVTPSNNRFLSWQDVVTVVEDGVTVRKRLVLIVSADAVHWFYYRDATGHIPDLWVPPPAPQYCATLGCWAYFETAARTPYGYHLIAANGWPAPADTHLFSCDAVHWRVLEAFSGVYNVDVQKGTNLVYDAQTDILHALTSSHHWTLTHPIFGC